jgi:hypothetical protein
MKKYIITFLILLLAIPVLAITFGSGGACAAVTGQVGCTTPGGMVRLGANTLTGLSTAAGHAIDAPNRFGYVSDSTNNKITKYNLDTLAVVATLTLGSDIQQPYGMVIDQPNNKLYVGARAATGGSDNDHVAKILKIDLSDFSTVTEARLNNNSGSQVIGLDIDLVNALIYASTSTSSGTPNLFTISASSFLTSSIVKATIDGGVSLYYGVSYDPSQDKVYVSNNGTGKLYKINPALTVNATSGAYGGVLAFDTANTLGYFADQSHLFKTSLTSLSPTQFTSPGGVSSIYDAGIDTTLGYAYYSTNQSPSIIGAVKTSNFTTAGTLTLNSGENGSLQTNRIQIDTIYHVLYHITSTNPAIVVKIQLQ